MKRNFFAILSISVLALITAALAQTGRMGRGTGPHGMMMGTLPPAISSTTNPASPARIDLGRMLFYDTRLSKDGTVSCNSCHDLENYGVDGRQFSLGVGGQKGGRNSPTVYNAAGQVLQFWDGRATTVEEQAKGPVLNPVEMAMASPGQVEERLRSVPAYAAAFRKAFPEQTDPLTFDNVAMAIGAFERGLVTPSRWDRFLAGDRSALSDLEFAGHREFMRTGCANCHNGPFVGGGSLQKAGVRKPWPVTSDLGREVVTKSETDRLTFKVPILRNVAKTAPYFHDGSVGQLDQAVSRMAEYQLGVHLTTDQVALIMAWLDTLTGQIPRDYIRKPDLP